MSFHIITDSTADIPRHQAEALGLTIVPLTVTFDGIEFRDGVDLSPEEFFQKLAHCKHLPTTSQVTVGAFLEAFGQAGERGEEVLGIFISQKLSGTYQSAVIAREQLGADNIWLTHTGSGSFGSQVLLRTAFRLRDEGKTARETMEILESLRTRLRLYAVVDTLKYLHKGGRLPAAVALVGGLLQVKPVMEVRMGEISMAGKARGTGAALEILAGLVESQGVDTRYPLTLGAAQCPERRDLLLEALARKLGPAQYPTCDIGVVIGTHTGPGCVGAAFIAKE